MSITSSQALQGLDAGTARSLLRTMLASREGDLREQSLIRQGKGWFHLAAMGHEGMAALALPLRADDYIFPYYRDRAFVLQRGISTYEIALGFFAKRGSSSGGRQLPAHFSKRSLNIWSHPSPVGSHLLPACGAAWGAKLDDRGSVVVASLGDGGARQGDFYEAVCFAKELRLPVLFVVEDNGVAISAATPDSNPLALGALAEEEWTRVDGTDVAAMAQAGRRAVERIRSGGGPAFLWCSVERFHSHSSADDHRQYRGSEELEAMRNRDPIDRFKRDLIAEGLLSASEVSGVADDIRSQMRADYARAGEADDPLPEELEKHLYGPLPDAARPPVDLGKKCRMLDAVNKTFHAAIEHDPDVVFFGEDIADPKGGVFHLTKGLSTAAPGRVVNSPVAESTIMGVAVGLASYGKRPCFEIQFVDFLSPGWNQLVTNMATLRWRSFGEWTCPLVIYAPCGAYLPGGALWHSQSGEGTFCRIPGLRVVVPGTPEDAAGLLWSALRGSDPTIVLLPKHLMWLKQKVPDPVEPIPPGVARHVQTGDEATLVAWGNCLELVEQVLDERETPVNVDFFDLRSIAPWDRETIRASVLRTGRLLIVQEDNISCSVGQMIVSELCVDPEVVAALKNPPILVSRGDVHIGFNPIYEYAALPDKARVEAALQRVLSGEETDAPDETEIAPEVSAKPGAASILTDSAADDIVAVTVPMLGEGIREARFLHKSKQEGEWVEADEALCELETEKATFAVEAEEPGWVVRWDVSDDDEVSVGQRLVTINRRGDVSSTLADRPANTSASSNGEKDETVNSASEEPRGGISSVPTKAAATSPASKSSTAQSLSIMHAQNNSSSRQPRPVYIAGITHVPGSRTVSNSDLLGPFTDWTEKDVAKRVGIWNRQWADDSETPVTLGARAIEALMESLALDPSRVTALLCSTGNGYQLSPSIACELVTRLFPQATGHEIQAVDINAACSGYLYALQQAHDLLQFSDNGGVIIVTSEVLSRFLNQEDPNTAFLFGDAATATFLTTNAHEVGDRGFAIRRPILSALPDPKRALEVPSPQSGHLAMDGLTVAREASRAMTSLLQRACAEQEIEPAELDWVVPHQASKRLIDQVAWRAGVAEERVINALDGTGNTSSSSIPICLADPDFPIKPGERIGLAAFGAGFTAGAALVDTFNPQTRK